MRLTLTKLGLAALGLFCLAAPRLSQAQDKRIVSGTVTDSGGRFIAYVTLESGPKFRTVTNAVGEFSVLVPAKDRFEVLVRRIGFLPTKLTIEPGTDTTIRVSMQQLAVLMTTQIVRAQQTVRTLELRGMYDRMLESQRGALVGDFILPEEIEMRNPNRVSQLLEARRGIIVRRRGTCGNIATCYVVYGTNGCAATVFLDGQRLNSLAAASNDVNAAPAVDELIPVSSVSGVEIYPRGALAPPKFQALGGTCAIVLIWTR